MKTKLFIATAFVSILLASCTHKSVPVLPVGNYVIAGYVGGFVANQHSVYRCISNGRVTEDASLPYNTPPADFSQFNFNVTLPSSKYDSVKNILSSIPPELFSQNNAHIGNIVPDVGYIDVWASVGGVSYRWYFWGDQSGSSAAVQQFVGTLRVLLD